MHLRKWEIVDTRYRNDLANFAEIFDACVNLTQRLFDIRVPPRPEFVYCTCEVCFTSSDIARLLTSHKFVRTSVKIAVSKVLRLVLVPSKLRCLGLLLCSCAIISFSLLARESPSLIEPFACEGSHHIARDVFCGASSSSVVCPSRDNRCRHRTSAGSGSDNALHRNQRIHAPVSRTVLSVGHCDLCGRCVRWQCPPGRSPRP